MSLHGQHFSLLEMLEGRRGIAIVEKQVHWDSPQLGCLLCRQFSVVLTHWVLSSDELIGMICRECAGERLK